MTKRLNKYIGLHTKPLEYSHTEWVLQVNRHRLLAPGLCVHGHGDLCLVHPNHPGPEICQDHATERRRGQPCQLNHTHTC